MSEHPAALLDAFLAMYAPRASLAIDEWRARYRRVAVVVTVPHGGRIVPDMHVRLLERDELRQAAGDGAGLRGALALMDSVTDGEQACMVVIFSPEAGRTDAIATTVQMHRTVDVRK